MQDFALIIPTLNAAEELKNFIPRLKRQTASPARFIVLDSESSDNTVDMAISAGAEIVTIKRPQFNHGGTRSIGAALANDTDVLVFMTQDAMLASDHSLERIVSHFSRPNVDAVYGRQLPRDEALPIEAFARLFNYPSTSDERSIKDRERLGFKLIFFSNSFSAYRTKKLNSIGGFRSDVIFGEDSIAVAEIISGGGTILYDSDAIVNHSHYYTISQEFKRYFDIGAMHARHPELLAIVGSPSSSGVAYVKQELLYLMRVSPSYIPEALVRTVNKYVGYRLGLIEKKISNRIKRKMSMNQKFWVSQA